MPVPCNAETLCGVGMSHAPPFLSVLHRQSDCTPLPHLASRMTTTRMMWKKTLCFSVVQSTALLATTLRSQRRRCSGQPTGALCSTRHELDRARKRWHSLPQSERPQSSQPATSATARVWFKAQTRVEVESRQLSTQVSIRALRTLSRWCLHQTRGEATVHATWLGHCAVARPLNLAASG